MDLVQSNGGNIIATLATADASHRNLRVEAFADPAFPDSGRIISRRSFLIAGGIEAIRAHDMALRLVAGEQVDLIELLGEGGRLAADLTASSFATIRGLASELELSFVTTASNLDPLRELLSWEIVGDELDSKIDFRIENPHAAAQFNFREDHAQTTNIDFHRFAYLPVDEREAGLSLGAIGIPLLFQGEALIVELSDARFEMRDNLVALKPHEHLMSNEQGGVLVEVIATNAAGDLRWRESVVVEIKENPFPWHNSASQYDTNNDGRVTPLDILLIINRLNEDLNRRLPAVRSPINGRDLWFDISQDGLVSPLDILLIINHFNRRLAGEPNDTALPHGKLS